MKVNIPLLLFTIVIFLLAAFFRLYGVNWDQGQHLHPDERFLTMVTEALQWPRNLTEYLDANTSPLNPHNKGFGFFVYGTFPIIFTRWVTDILGKTNYTDITLTGRRLSALFDLGTVILVLLITKQMIIRNTNYVIRKTFPLLAMFFYASMVLPIQLSHFFAVDTYLNFFITLSFYFLVRIMYDVSLTNYNFVFLGLSLGLAAGSKISALLFLPIIGLGILYTVLRKREIIPFIVHIFLIIAAFYLTLRFAQPYLFAHPDVLDLTLNQKVVENWKQLKSFDDKTGGFPPAVQWITTKPYIFPLKNMIYWGLGVPMGIIAVFCILYLFFSVILNLFQDPKKMLNQALQDKSFIILILSLLWILLLFGYQGSQFVKALRYFYPIYPFLALLAGYFSSVLFFYFFKKNRKIFLFFVICYLLFVIVYPLSFLSIYSRPHSRVAASQWIYDNVKTGSTVTMEHWDDALPLGFGNYIRENYKTIELPLYGPDNKEKWEEMDIKLHSADYIFLTSNRLYGSIMTIPVQRPVTYTYYEALFSGRLGFEKVAEFTSRPNIPVPFIKWCFTPPGARYGIIAKPSQECSLPGISFVDDYADETFTVYDHPKVIIFKKVKEVDYRKILDI